MKKAVEKVLTEKEVQKIVTAEGVSKSAKVKALFEGGLEVKEIAAALNISYNFAYNVLKNYVIVNDIEVVQTERNSKRADIEQLLASGMSIAEVSKHTKTNYNYIWKINKELQSGKEQDQQEIAK